MSPTPGSDPSAMNTGASPRDIDPSYDVLENRGIHVVTLLRGEMLDGREIETLGAELKAYFETKPRAKVALDMHAVHHLSSAALGMLLTLRTAIEGAGGKLVLAGLRDDLLQIFEITRLHKIFTIKENVSAATASL